MSLSYRIHVSDRWADRAAELKADAENGAPTPFQSYIWLDAWYRNFVDEQKVFPRIVTIRDQNDELVMHLPLIKICEGRKSHITFADLGYTDNNAPIIGAYLKKNKINHENLIKALKQNLDGDILFLEKMPMLLSEIVNPLIPQHNPAICALNQNIVELDDNLEVYWRSLKKHARKDNSRIRRNFECVPNSAFVQIRDADQAKEIFAYLEAQQKAHLESLGVDHKLNDERASNFYRDMLLSGLQDEFSLLTALKIGDEIIASTLGIRHGATCVMLRVSHGSSQYTNLAPGRLALTMTLEAMHAQGVRHFDLSVGNYTYKRRLGAQPVAMANLTHALSWRGQPTAIRVNLINLLARHPELDRRIRQWLGRRRHQDELQTTAAQNET